MYPSLLGRPCYVRNWTILGGDTKRGSIVSTSDTGVIGGAGVASAGAGSFGRESENAFRPSGRFVCPVFHRDVGAFFLLWNARPFEALHGKLSFRLLPSDSSRRHGSHGSAILLLVWGWAAIHNFIDSNPGTPVGAYASVIYGWYTGLVYLTPLLGGYLADRYWGQRKTVLIRGCPDGDWPFHDGL